MRLIEVVLCVVLLQNAVISSGNPLWLRRELEMLGASALFLSCERGSHPANITERLLSSVCGDVTDTGRWVLFGHIFLGPSFDMLAYSNNSAFDRLLSFASYDSSAIPLHVRKIGGFMCTET